MWRGESQISGKGKLRLESLGGGEEEVKERAVKSQWQRVRWVYAIPWEKELYKPAGRSEPADTLTHRAIWPPSSAQLQTHTHAHTHTLVTYIGRINHYRILGKNVKSNQHLYNCWRHVTHWHFACTNTRALLYEILHSLNSYCKILPLTSVNCND